MAATGTITINELPLETETATKMKIVTEGDRHIPRLIEGTVVFTKTESEDFTTSTGGTVVVEKGNSINITVKEGKITAITGLDGTDAVTFGKNTYTVTANGLAVGTAAATSEIYPDADDKTDIVKISDGTSTENKYGGFQ